MLDIQTELIEPRQMRLTVNVPLARLQKAMDEVGQAAAKQARIPGYRPGKVPARLLEQYLDMDKVRAEALHRLRDRLAREAVLQAELEPGGPVTVEVSDGDPPVFTYLVPLTPQVNLGAYASELRVPFTNPAAVSEEAVDEQIERWLGTYAYLAPVDRPSEAGDVMHLSLVGVLEGREVYLDEDLELSLAPEAAVEVELPAEIVRHLMGLKAGDTHRFDVAFSEFWPDAELRGRTVAFTATILSVNHEELPALDDDFVQNTVGAATVEDVRGAVRRGLEEEAQKAAFRQYRNVVLEALTKQAEIEYPPVILDMETVDFVMAFRRDVEAQGLTWQRFLELEQKTENDLLAEFEPLARRRLEQRLALETFALAEHVAVAKEEVETFLSIVRESAPKEQRPSKAQVQQMRRRVTAGLMTDKAYARLAQIALGGEEALLERFGDLDASEGVDIEALLEDEGGPAGDEVRLSDTEPDKGVLTVNAAD